MKENGRAPSLFVIRVKIYINRVFVFRFMIGKTFGGKPVGLDGRAVNKLIIITALGIVHPAVSFVYPDVIEFCFYLFVRSERHAGRKHTGGRFAVAFIFFIGKTVDSEDRPGFKKQFYAVPVLFKKDKAVALYDKRRSLKERAEPFKVYYDIRSFTTSPAIISPAAPGTKDTEPGSLPFSGLMIGSSVE